MKRGKIRITHKKRILARHRNARRAERHKTIKHAERNKTFKKKFIKKSLFKKFNSIRPVVNRIAMVALIIFFIAYIVFFSNIIKRDCGNDINCFNNAAARCSGGKIELLKDINVYAYYIAGPLKSDCIIDVKLKFMAVGTPIEMKDKMEGKSMQCKIPKELLKANSIDKIDGLLAYCSGPLKESLYEVLIDKMYALIIKNMANITKNVQDELARAI